MNRKKAIWLTVPFLSIVFGFSLASFVTPDKEESKAENRALAQKPIAGKTGDKTYTESYEKYFTDQFPLRDDFLKIYMNNEILLGKTDVKGYYLLDDGWILQKNKLRLSEAEAKRYSDIINSYAETLKSRGKDVYYAATPQKENILVDLIPKYSNLDVLLRNSERFLTGLNEDLISLVHLRPMFLDRFSSSEIESFYLKTDNHWNSIGAYHGFKMIIESMSKGSKLDIKIDDDSYTKKELKDRNFLGVYNRNLYEIYPSKENIPYVYKKNMAPRTYLLHDGERFVNVDRNKIVATGIKKSTLTYPAAYASSDLHYKAINNSAPIDKKLLIYRDSYHSAVSWMFEDIFREVEVIDPRYITSSNTTNRKEAESTDADIVLFMFNDLGFTNMIDELDD